MRDVLLIDLGKTSCIGAIGRARVGPPREVPGSPGLAAQGGLDAAMTAIRSVAHALETPPASVSVGAAGALAAPDTAGLLAGRIIRELGVAGACVTSDVVTAHAGALGGRPGVVVIAGTGVAAFAAEPSGRAHLVDGAGPDRGDVGGGGWLGAQALHQAVQRPGEVRDLVVARFGPAWSDLADRADPDAARERAALVPDLAAAAGAGSDAAEALLVESARSVAATARAAVQRTAVDGPVDLCIVGGLRHLGSIWHDALRHQLARDGRVRWREAEGGALEGALLIDRDRSLPHEAYVHRVDVEDAS